ncbi:MAG TPA: mercuric reductase [Vicinamibacterales bacterium]|nr:mercuric reductase [Vicinamibacterales bacterium]
MTEPPLIVPLDEANRDLLDRVHPPAWQNPAGRGVYDLVVLGGGTGGLVCAFGAAGLGARVALVEQALLGGDCLNTGCVPSKAILRSARVIGEVRRAAGLGVRIDGPVDADFGAVMERMRRRRAGIAPHDSAERLRAAGVDVFFGTARFADRRRVEVGGRVLRFNRAIVATGGRPSVPAVPGLAATPHLTSETLFQLTERPARLLIVGAGPIGCEMAQAFARLGSHVTMLDAAPQVLPREDPDAAAIVARRLADDHVRCELGVRLTQAAATPGGGVTVQFARGDAAPAQLEGDALLVAAGRTPNVEELRLEAAGIAVDRGGVAVDDRLRTTNRRVFAVGDVCSAWKFTHVADAMARIALQNALFYGRRRMSALTIPWCTYTDPEVAHVGLDAAGAARRDGVDTITVPLGENDRSVVDGETDGFLRVHHERGRLLGCTVVAPHAGELIGEASLLVTRGGTLGQLAGTIHPYPTVADAFRAAGDAYRRTLLTPSARRWMARYFRWTRGGGRPGRQESGGGRPQSL